MKNREIKFRIWFKKMKQFSYFELYDLIDNCDGYAGNRKKDFVLQQSSGRKDKNGTEIYEGDVVKVDWNGTNIYQIDRSGSSFVFMPTNRKICADQGYLDETCSDLIEVIGNTYENKNLLK